MLLCTLCYNRMGLVRRVKCHSRVPSRIRRGHAGWGGVSLFQVLLFVGLRKLGTAFGTGGLPTCKRVRHLLKEINKVWYKMWHALVTIKLCTHAKFCILFLKFCLCKWNHRLRVKMCIIKMIPPPHLAVNQPLCILYSCVCTVQQLAQKGW